MKDWLIENNVLISHKKLVRESDPQKAEDISYDKNKFSLYQPNYAKLSDEYTEHVLGDTVYDYTEVNKYLYCANYRPNERSAYCLLNDETQGTEKVKWYKTDQRGNLLRHQWYAFTRNLETSEQRIKINEAIKEYSTLTRLTNKPMTSANVLILSDMLIFYADLQYQKQITMRRFLGMFQDKFEDYGIRLIPKANPTSIKVEKEIDGNDNPSNNPSNNAYSTSQYKQNAPMSICIGNRLVLKSVNQQKITVTRKFGNININTDQNKLFLFLNGTYKFILRETFVPVLWQHTILPRLLLFTSKGQPRVYTAAAGYTATEEISQDLRVGRDNTLFVKRLKKLDATLDTLLDLHGPRFDSFSQEDEKWRAVHGCAKAQAEVFWPQRDLVQNMVDNGILAWSWVSPDKTTEIAMIRGVWVFKNRFLINGESILDFMKNYDETLPKSAQKFKTTNIMDNFYAIKIPAILVPLYTERVREEHHMWSSFLAWQKIAAKTTVEILNQTELELIRRISSWNDYVDTIQKNEGGRYLEERMSVLVNSYLTFSGLV